MPNLASLSVAALGAVGGAVTVLSAYGAARFRAPGRTVVAILAAVGGAAITVTGSRWRRQSITDDATSLYNRRYLFARLGAELTQARRKRETLGFIVAEVDNMRHYNNTYGHLAGDAVLLAVAQAIRGGVRSGDVVGRWGGDEFGIILPHTDGMAALLVAERVHHLVGQLAVEIGDGRRVRVTISAGVANSPLHGDSIRELVNRADKAMYVAKERKNRVILAA